MDTLQNYWEFIVFEKKYYLSPYLFFNAIGFIFGIFILDKQLKSTFSKRHDEIYIIYIFSIIAGWFGAHLFDFLFKDQSFGNAGFTFLGGLIFGSSFFILLFRIVDNKGSLIKALDAGVRPLVLGHAIGRVGCYLSGCCFGKIINHSNFLPSYFTRHPTQIYESLFLFLLFSLLSFKEKLKISVLDLYIYFISYGIFRFFIEFLRGDFRGQYLIKLSPSQWVSLILIFLGTSQYFVTKYREIRDKYARIQNT